MTNGLYGGTAKDVIYKVASSDPLHIHVLSDGTVLKGLYRLKNLEGAKIEDKGYLRYGCCYINFKDIVPVPLTTEILEKNGWEHQDDVYFKEYPHRKLVVIDEKACIINESYSLFLCKVEFVHQLQHLLFGLGVNEEMNLEV